MHPVHQIIYKPEAISTVGNKKFHNQNRLFLATDLFSIDTKAAKNQNEHSPFFQGLKPLATNPTLQPGPSLKMSPGHFLELRPRWDLSRRTLSLVE